MGVFIATAQLAKIQEYFPLISIILRGPFHCNGLTCDSNGQHANDEGQEHTQA